MCLASERNPSKILHLGHLCRRGLPTLRLPPRRCIARYAVLFPLLALTTVAMSPLTFAGGTEHVSYTIGAPGNVSEVAIKGDVGTGSVQPGGTYSFSIPIEVPPGPRGTAPS